MKFYRHFVIIIYVNYVCIYNVHYIYVDYRITNSDYVNMFNALYIRIYRIGIGLYLLPYISYRNIS